MPQIVLYNLLHLCWRGEHTTGGSCYISCFIFILFSVWVKLLHYCLLLWRNSFLLRGLIKTNCRLHPSSDLHHRFGSCIPALHSPCMFFFFWIVTTSRYTRWVIISQWIIGWGMCYYSVFLMTFLFKKISMVQSGNFKLNWVILGHFL